MAISAKKPRLGVVPAPPGGAAAQVTGGGAWGPFAGVAPESTSLGAGRTIWASSPRRGREAAGPAGDGPPARPGTGPEGNPRRMWCSLLSVIARSSCRRPVTGGGVRCTAGGDDTDARTSRGLFRAPGVDGAHPAISRDGLRPVRCPAGRTRYVTVVPFLSCSFLRIPVVLRSGVIDSAPCLESRFFLPDRRWGRSVMWRRRCGGSRMRRWPAGAAAVDAGA
jgi:hypothetical protein